MHTLVLVDGESYVVCMCAHNEKNEEKMEDSKE